jgi:hypothetical protein
MAQAPRPGVAKRKEAQQQARKVLRLTVDGVTVEVCPDNLPISERVALRKACGGLPLSAFWGDSSSIDIDSFQVLFWLGRRACGEPSLQLSEVEENWPENIGAPGMLEAVVIDPEETDDENPES